VRAVHAADGDFGIRYLNPGDWVESCTAIGEHHDGSLEILRWKEWPSVDAEPGEGLLEGVAA
jgi:UDP-2,3-diacylglucosamine pyrophosphatase LpxH